MIRPFLVSLLLSYSANQLSAQCIVSDWSVPPEVCRESNFVVENNSIAESFEWDLCPFDLLAIPTVSKVINTGLSSTLDLTVARDSSKHYGFAIDPYSNSVLRLDFDTAIENIPVKVDLGNIGGLLDFPNSIAIVQEGSTWLGLVANANNSNIILLNFGTSLKNLPTASVLHSRSSGGFANIAIASTSDLGRALVVAEYSTNQVSVFNYPEGFLKPLGSQQSVAISGSTPIDIQIIKQCGEWKAMVLSFDNRKLYQLNFGNSLVNSPVVSEYGLTLGFEPYRLSIVVEGDFFYAFVTSTSGGLHRLAFDTDIDNNPTVEALGSFGVLSNSRSFYLDSENGRWQALMINFSDGDLFRLSFQKDCGVSPAYAAGRTPGYIQFAVAGNQRIAVTAYQADGTSAVSSQQVLVTNNVAPNFSIQRTNSCVNHEVYFEAYNIEGVITNYRWTFGDGDSSFLSTPPHIYSTPGTFPVILNVVGDNLCPSQREIDVAIFEEPVSDFLLPSMQPLCTNEMLEFTNVSDFNVASNPSWKWFVNALEVSGQKDLSYEMTSAGPHTIRLVAAIPGCDSDFEATLGPLIEGPFVDFEYSGICLGKPTSFSNKSTGSIKSFEWDFDDGNFSFEANPDNLYAAFGNYSVTLSVTDEAGCNNHRTKTLDIHSIPAIDFSIKEAPFSCANTPTPFYNQTNNPDGSEIVAWLWQFNDSIEQTGKDPQHIFPIAGTYNVSLHASTEFGCEAIGQKEITILPSPATEFTYTPACDDVPVQFTGPFGNDIERCYWEIGSSYYDTPSPTHTFKAPGNYPLYLEVTGSNGCMSSTSRSIHVPVPLTPDFSFLKNCPEHEAVFTDMTTGVDSIISREWRFPSGETFTLSPMTYTFHETGAETITLRVTAQSGCQYQASKVIEIVPAPLAHFAADPPVGAQPHTVLFTNTSTNASEYRWNFSDGTGTISTAVSPGYTFHEVGSYNVELTAFNEQQCEHSFRGAISTVAPLPDADIEMIMLSPNPDGTSRLIVTVANNGNTILADLPLDIDFSGGLTVREHVRERILPGSKFNVVFNVGIVNVESLRYLCVFIDLDNDVAPAANRACKQLENSLFIFPAYPNPATASLNVEWVAETKKSVRISLVDGLGRKILAIDYPSDPGLNHQMLDLSGVENGIYSLLVGDGVIKKIQRILITSNR